MGFESNISVRFDNDMLDLFSQMEELREKYKLKRINSIMLVMALLEEEDSLFYDSLCETSNNGNPYKKILSECKKQLKSMSEKEDAEGEVQEEDKFCIGINKEVKTFYTSKNLRKVIINTYQLVLEDSFQREGDGVKQIDVYTSDLFICLIKNPPKDVLKILKNNGVNMEAILEYYDILREVYEPALVETKEDEAEEGKLPKAISDFATILSLKYKGVKECEILGRDEECKKIMRILQKRGKKNAVIIGEPGVGKTAIAEKIAFLIASGNCPESLKGYMVIQVDVNNSIAGTMYRGMAEERFKLLVEYLNTHDNVILFIDEIHMVIGAGATAGDDSGNMSNALKPYLASKKSKVVGATTLEEYEKHFSRDKAFKRRFEMVMVKEPKSAQIYDMLRNAIKAHEEYHGVTITKEMVEYAILIASCFDNKTNNPDRTNDLIDCAMVIAKENGKQQVDRESILANFDIDFEKFEKMDEYQKKSTAYHEAGHYLLWRKSEKLKDIKGIAISIMPAEDYLGVTVYDDVRDEVTVYADSEYYIDYLAKCVAGRVAEELYTGRISSGASADLETANKLAYQMVTKYGMIEENGNRAYYEDYQYHMMTEKICNNIDEEVKKLMEKATKRAKEVLLQNDGLLKKLVEALLEKHILDENDLEELCKE